MAQHTNGPWAIHTRNEHCGFRIDGANGRAVAHAIQREEHPSIGQGISKDEAEANARLIACAPMMLQVMRDTLREVASSVVRGAGAGPHELRVKTLIDIAKPESPIGVLRDAIKTASGGDQ